MASMEMVGHLATPKAKVPHNKALHQTRRGGAVASRPVVEARLAGEGRCCTDRRTDRRSLYLHPPRSRKLILATEIKRTSIGDVGQALQQPRPSIGNRSSIFQDHVDWGPTVSVSMGIVVARLQ